VKVLLLFEVKVAKRVQKLGRSVVEDVSREDFREGHQRGSWLAGKEEEVGEMKNESGRTWEE